MKNFFNLRNVAMAACLAATTMFASCDKEEDNNKGGIGSNPNIPAWAQNAPASAAALVASWEANSEFSDIESYSYGGTDYVDAIRTVGGKEYAVVATKYGTPAAASQYFQSMKASWDLAIAYGGEAALKQVLAEDGITNFNMNDTGISYTQNGYEIFYKITGSWVFAQGPND